MKKRSELEEICRKTHMLPVSDSAMDQTIVAIESGIVDATLVLEHLDQHISKVKEEALSRKEILAQEEILSNILWTPQSLACDRRGRGKDYVRYRAQISVYDNSEQAVFVLLGDAGRALTGKHASELVSSYFEANGNQGVNHEVPVPEALISTIGQRHKFCVKATEHNLSGKTRSLTVSKILSLDTPPATEALAGNHIAATSEKTFQTGNDV
ncbi:hypothetical protein Bca101_036244 [Brassica carinata]